MSQTPTMSGWVEEDPGSPLLPRQERTIWVINQGDKQEVAVRFCYLSDYEIAEVQAEAVRFARVTFKLDPMPAVLLQKVERAFLLARALRKSDDIEVQYFQSANRASAGEMALRRLPPQEAERSVQAWWDWMEAEFPDAGVNKEQLDKMTDDAAGE